MKLWFWERKRFANFFRVIGVPKKLQIFKKYFRKYTIQEICKKKDNFAPQITPFLTHPVCLVLFCIEQILRNQNTSLLDPMISRKSNAKLQKHNKAHFENFIHVTLLQSLSIFYKFFNQDKKPKMNLF